MKKIILITLISVQGVLIFSYGQNRRKTENVFIITLDGLRWQEVFTGADSLLITNKTFVKDPVGLSATYWAETATERRATLMPFLWKDLARQGQIYGNRNYRNNVNVTNTMWFSYPGYNEILCGYADDTRIKTNNKILNPNVTVLEYINRDQKFNGKVAAFGSWDVFPYIINEERSGVPVNAGFEKATGSSLSEKEKILNELQDEVPSPWATVRLDAFTHHFLMEHLRKHTPKVVYVAYGETDDFAHDGKYDAYLRSARQSDAFIKQLWQYVQSTPAYKDKTTFIITTDHGRGTIPLDAWRNHGREVAGADQIWFAVIGPDTPPAGEIKTAGQVYQNQFAKTVAAFLGIDYKSVSPIGEVIKGVVKK
jgi:hypothetical protein